jgi:hypothetical protein
MTPQDPLPAGDPFSTRGAIAAAMVLNFFQCPLKTDFGDSYEQDL